MMAHHCSRRLERSEFLALATALDQDLTQGILAWGGVHLAQDCIGVELRRNRIEGGLGCSVCFGVHAPGIRPHATSVGGARAWEHTTARVEVLAAIYGAGLAVKRTVDVNKINRTV
jgi:hypothetical protein